MAPASYSLPIVTANLIERLEGARRTWMESPDDARAGLRRIADETMDVVVAEHDELLGDDGTGARLRKEVIDTFLPRYTRLAIDHNALEYQGYHAWRKGDPVARIVATAAAFFLALVLTRVVHHPAVAAFYGLALLVPFIPEIRGAWFRRRYRLELQAVVDDMVRIQDELDRYAVGSTARPALAAKTDSEEVSPSRPPSQREPAR